MKRNKKGSFNSTLEIINSIYLLIPLSLVGLFLFGVIYFYIGNGLNTDDAVEDSILERINYCITNDLLTPDLENCFGKSQFYIEFQSGLCGLNNMCRLNNPSGKYNRMDVRLVNGESVQIRYKVVDGI